MSNKPYNERLGMHIGDIGFAGEKLGFGLPQVSEAGVKQTASLLGRYFPELSVAISPKGKRGGRLGRGDTAQTTSSVIMRQLQQAPTFNITQTASPVMTASPTINVTLPKPPTEGVSPTKPTAVKAPETPPSLPINTPPAAPPPAAPVLPVAPAPTPSPTPAPTPVIEAPTKPTFTPVPDPYNWLEGMKQIAVLQAKPVEGRGTGYSGQVVVTEDGRMVTARKLAYPKPARFKSIQEILGGS